MARPRISLCLIVRDEEEFLDACLASAAPWVNEVCVVDTGSTDRSVEIAASYGARIGHFAWNDSFADARNACLDLATGDWILVLDADEVLAPGSGEALRKLARRDDLLAALLALENEGCEGHAWVQRFFRHHPEHRYERAVHEQLGAGFETRAVAQTAETGRCIVLAEEARILHRGHAPEVAERRHKAARMGALYARAVADRPDDAYLAYKHAEFLRGEHDAVAARRAFERAVACVEAMPDAEAARFAHCAEIYALQAATLLEDGDVAGAARALDRGFQRTTPTAHLHFVEGLRRLGSCDWQEALAAFEACRNVAGPARIAAPLPGVTTWKSALGIADALAGLGRLDDAVAALTHEIEAGRPEPELPTHAARLLADAGRLGEALSTCSRALARDQKAWQVWDLTASLLQRAGRPDVAEEAARKARQWAPASVGGPPPH